MTKRFLLLTCGTLTAACVALFGFGGSGSLPAAAATSDESAGSLAQQFTTAPSAAVTARLERRVAADPADGTARTLLGLAYQQRFRETGNPAWLAQATDALAQAEPHVARDDVLYLTASAQLAGTKHRFGEAIVIARKALAVDPTSAVALGALGDALRENGRYREAFAVIDRLAAQGPSVAGYARVAFARQQIGDRAGAIEALELALEAGSGITEQLAWARTHHATLLLAAGRVDDAERGLRRALREAPGYVHAKAGLAYVALARGRTPEAIRRFEAVLAGLPNLPYAVTVADLYHLSGDLPNARRAENRINRIVATYDRVGINISGEAISHDLDRNLRVAEALRSARAGYRTDPNVETADTIAWALYRLDRCAEARRWSTRAFRNGIEDAGFLFHRGLIEQCLGNGAAARSYMQRSLEADPYFSARFGPLVRRIAGSTP